MTKALNSSRPAERDRPADEIEITPQMIGAGLEAYRAYRSDDRDVVPDEQIVREVLEAVLSRHTRNHEAAPDHQSVPISPWWRS